MIENDFSRVTYCVTSTRMNDMSNQPMSLNDSLQFTGGASQLAKLGAPKSRPLVDIIISSLYPLILRSTVFSLNLCELPEALSRISSIFLCFRFPFSFLSPFFPACSFPSPGLLLPRYSFSPRFRKPVISAIY